MNFLVEFFRDTLSGIWYYLYLIICIIMFFYVLGIVADRKRLEISKKLKEKKTYDIESGKEAQIAAMESKQVLSVGLTEENKEEVKKQEEPMIISDSNNNAQTNQSQDVQLNTQVQPILNSNNELSKPSNNAANQTEQISQKQAVEPLVLNSNE